MKKVALFIACAAAAVATPAFAKQCPPGKILRVSQGVCMDKAEAIKDGIFRSGRSDAAKSDSAKSDAAKSDAAKSEGGVTRVARLSVSERAQARGEAQSEMIRRAERDTGRVNSAVAAYAPAPSADVTPAPESRPKPAASPYGALRLDYFGPR